MQFYTTLHACVLVCIQCSRSRALSTYGCTCICDARVHYSGNVYSCVTCIICDACGYHDNYVLNVVIYTHTCIRFLHTCHRVRTHYDGLSIMHNIDILHVSCLDMLILGLCEFTLMHIEYDDTCGTNCPYSDLSGICKHVRISPAK